MPPNGNRKTFYGCCSLALNVIPTAVRRFIFLITIKLGIFIVNRNSSHLDLQENKQCYNLGEKIRKKDQTLLPDRFWEPRAP